MLPSRKRWKENQFPMSDQVSDLQGRFSTFIIPLKQQYHLVMCLNSFIYLNFQLGIVELDRILDSCGPPPPTTICSRRPQAVPLSMLSMRHMRIVCASQTSFRKHAYSFTPLIPNVAFWHSTPITRYGRI